MNGSGFRALAAAVLLAGFMAGGPVRTAWSETGQEESPASPAELKKRERSIISQLDELDHRRIGLKKTRQRLEGEIRALSKEEDEAQDETRRLEERKVALNRSLKGRIKALYLHGRTGLVRLSLAAESIRDTVLGRRCLVRMVGFDLKLMEDYNVLQEELVGLKSALALKKKRMSGLVQEMARADMELAAHRSARARLLLEVDRSQEVHQKALNEMDRAAGELNRRLASLESSISEKSDEADSHILAAEKGRLPWPVKGKPQRMADPKRRGVIIKTKEGSPVRAVSSGRVIHTGWIKGYGLVVIVDHGARYYTLSAHLEEITVRSGGQVERGQVIGTSGRAALAEPGVYFEIRHREKTLNSREWLGEPSG